MTYLVRNRKEIKSSREGFRMLQDSDNVSSVQKNKISKRKEQQPTYRTTLIEWACFEEIPLKLTKPLKLRVRYSNGRNVIRSDVFNIFSFDPDLKKAILDLEYQFFILWEADVLEDKKRLTSGGIQLRNLLKEYAEEENVFSLL
ncbi:hypothetical protein MsAm2_00290 [Methanolapillus ohkumae]|uniref:Uncharacterized protein n=2 Tax=Methanolapillus ohkumae TaxID=3028298 RepID=A0AA96ZV29_9EURY|nr:hypothetical protein MsAm2_00290 [Methanosarcinaceae archaeon Am2]